MLPTMESPFHSTEPNKKARYTLSLDGTIQMSKRVTFVETPTVFQFEAFEEDGDGNEADNLATTSTTRKTCEMTVLSSEHGRARRQLRNITKHDLQTCIKYGIKSPGRRHPKTGEQRWLYYYDGVTYVTDSTGRIEVTSYKDPVQIERAVVTQDMERRHDEQVLALSNDPMICTTHSIIILDQSGSMRTADVANFRSRSHAAYGVLALEYIAEQLHNRPADDGAIDSVSIIEMHDYGSLYLEDEPMDWLLFNNLIDRQSSAQPRSHGKYNNAPELAVQLISKKLEQSEGMPLEDMPAFALIFLTDGKPSDRTPYDEYDRKGLLKDMASLIGSRLTFKAIGLGDSIADFSVLADMATELRLNGVDATFEFAHNCAAMLSTTLSSVATSMTKTRDTLLSSTCHVRVERVVQLRDRNTPKLERRFVPYTVSVSRWILDCEKDEEDDEWPWSQAIFLHHRTRGFEIDELPFGKGRERLAYMFLEIDDSRKRVGKALVAKESMIIEDAGSSICFHLSFCRDQVLAQTLARRFNDVVSNCDDLHPVEGGCMPPVVMFAPCSIYEYSSQTGMLEGLLVEPFLRGKFTKFNGNNGYVCQSTVRRKQIALAIGEVHLTDFLHAFSHWSLVESGFRRLVCDLQGVLNEEGRNPKFELTDPCICRRRSKGAHTGRSKRKKNRNTDLAMWGIRHFSGATSVVTSASAWV